MPHILERTSWYVSKNANLCTCTWLRESECRKLGPTRDIEVQSEYCTDLIIRDILESAKSQRKLDIRLEFIWRKAWLLDLFGFVWINKVGGRFIVCRDPCYGFRWGETN